MDGDEDENDEFSGGKRVDLKKYETDFEYDF